MSIRSSLRGGLLAGIINLFIILLGLTVLLGRLIGGWLGLASPRPGAWILLLFIAFWGGRKAAQRAQGDSWRDPAVLAGGVHGILLGTFTWLVSTLTNSGAALRKWLVQLTPDAIDLLTLGNPPLTAAVVIGVAALAASLAGALLTFASARYHWRDSFRNWMESTRGRVQETPAIERFRRRKNAQYILYGIALVALLIAPLFLGRYWNYTLGTVGIYVMLGLGLNIVVGFAGLLDLGYVAFFAIGAYTVAMLTAPTPHGILMDFWLALPIGVVLAALSGILLGIPVLRMRGDYLAIVTLGFGEIIRILSKSDALTGFTGGPRGIRSVAGPNIFGMDVSSSMHFMYFIILGIALIAFMTARLQRSRVGRAWMAMREDEDVAGAMGIYVLKYKLLAFAIGAAFAGLGGAVFASRNKFTGPEDFTLMVSINVLCLVIIGGMGSMPGVIMGALVLKGLPEILRQLQDYRMLAFGALLVVMMIVRPEGIWPSARRKMELYEHLETSGGGSAGPAAGARS